MIFSLLSLVAGAAMVLWGADKLTDAATTVARCFGISEMVIGLTIVSIGTSLPELCISMSSVFAGSSDISVGNIVGSNIFNVLVIVGLSALVSPIVVAKNTITKDIPFALLAGVVLILAAWDGTISVTDGLTLLCFFAVFMWYTFSISGAETEASKPRSPEAPLWKSTLFGLLGLGALVWGGDLFVDGASAIALSLGVSEMVVGLTIVAAGTSLPELATSVVAARKGASAIAIGNVIGSNLFNVFFVMGVCSTIKPTPTLSLAVLDEALLVVSVLLMWGFATTSRRVGRLEGALMFLSYILYTICLTW